MPIDGPFDKPFGRLRAITCGDCSGQDVIAKKPKKTVLFTLITDHWSLAAIAAVVFAKASPPQGSRSYNWPLVTHTFMNRPGGVGEKRVDKIGRVR